MTNLEARDAIFENHAAYADFNRFFAAVCDATEYGSTHLTANRRSASIGDLDDWRHNGELPTDAKLVRFLRGNGLNLDIEEDGGLSRAQHRIMWKKLFETRLERGLIENIPTDEKLEAGWVDLSRVTPKQAVEHLMANHEIFPGFAEFFDAIFRAWGVDSAQLVSPSFNERQLNGWRNGDVHPERPRVSSFFRLNHYYLTGQDYIDIIGPKHEASQPARGERTPQGAARIPG